MPKLFHNKQKPIKNTGWDLREKNFLVRKIVSDGGHTFMHDTQTHKWENKPQDHIC